MDRRDFLKMAGAGMAAGLLGRSLSALAQPEGGAPRPNIVLIMVDDMGWSDRKVGTAYALRRQPNAWGLMHMHGNAAEWTRSLYRPYPYRADDGRNDPNAEGKRVVRGGSFSDRPKRCTASYRSWQGVYNVGFRVIIRPDAE